MSVQSFLLLNSIALYVCMIIYSYIDMCVFSILGMLK